MKPGHRQYVSGSYLEMGLSIVILFCLISILLVYQDLTKSKMENSDLKKQIEDAKKDISNKEKDLKEKTRSIKELEENLTISEATVNLLENRINQLETQGKKLSSALEDTNQRFYQLSNEIENMQSDLINSMKWFKDNSELPSASTFENKERRWQYETFLNDRIFDCIKKEGSDKILRLVCINYMLDNILSFTYLFDPPVNDKLYPISESISNGGGDCEDYSLFFKGLLNSLKENDLYRNLTLEIWEKTPDDSKYFRIENRDQAGSDEYYPGRAKLLGQLNEFFFYVICYTVDETYGHCIVAASKKEISSIDSLYSLNFAMTFDPQNSQYMGNIGEDFTLCNDSILDCTQKPNHITAIIGNNDIYQFNTEGKWTSNAYYQDKLKELESSMN